MPLILKKRRSTVTVVISLLAVAGLVVLFQTKAPDGLASKKRAEVSQLQRVSPARPVASSDPAKRWDSDPRKAERVRELNRLKAEFSKLRNGLGAATDLDLRNQLSAEAARSLLCSEECVELIEYLSSIDAYNTIDLSVEGLLRSSPLAGEARALLVSLKTDPGDSGIGWYRVAGEGCPVEELDQLLDDLGGGAHSQEALFGRNIALVTTDPESAVRSTLAQLEKNVSSNSVNGSLIYLMAKLPSGVDFSRIEALLPGVDPYTRSPVNICRSTLFEKWAEVDPAAASNCILSQPSRFNPHLIGPIVDKVMAKDFQSGIEWLAEFPPGPYYDAAARQAVPYLRGTQDERMKAVLRAISDPTEREAALRALSEPTEEAGGN